MELVTIAQKTGSSESYESKFTMLKDEIGALRQIPEQCRAKQNGPDELTRQTDDICRALQNAPFESTVYNDSVVRQLIDTIKVVNKDKLLIAFKGHSVVILRNVNSKEAPPPGVSLTLSAA